MITNEDLAERILDYVPFPYNMKIRYSITISPYLVQSKITYHYFNEHCEIYGIDSFKAEGMIIETQEQLDRLAKEYGKMITTWVNTTNEKYGVEENA